MAPVKANKFDESLLKILACPLCHKTLKHDKQKKILLCKKCNKKYPIRDGIPIMLPDEANN